MGVSVVLAIATSHRAQASSAYRCSARRNSRFQNRRLTSTTETAIASTPAASSGKLPLAVAWLMRAPSPKAAYVSPLTETYSETIEAFHEPPAAVTSPVIRCGKTHGRYNRVHILQRLGP